MTTELTLVNPSLAEAMARVVRAADRKRVLVTKRYARLCKGEPQNVPLAYKAALLELLENWAYDRETGLCFPLRGRAQDACDMDTLRQAFGVFSYTEE